MTLEITSGAFEHGGDIPEKYTCEGSDISPPLSWNGLPAGTKSVVLIMDDPDAPDPKAPQMTWDHWVLYNLPPDSSGLAEHVSDTDLPAGTLQGMNDWKRTGYGGPCPPTGNHRYFYKLYALDTVLDDMHEPTKVQLEEAMQSHILEQAVLMGFYAKS
jgi:Raf kinase inhibitor-like YbhB/YbcL family protein